MKNLSIFVYILLKLLVTSDHIIRDTIVLHIFKRVRIPIRPTPVPRLSPTFQFPRKDILDCKFNFELPTRPW